MESVPRISVVIATHNYGRFIAEALESVLAQSLTDREIVVVDDGSTDDTAAAVRPYLQRIRYVAQPHLGVSAAWNRGIAEARGRWVAFLAADDRWDPRMLEKVAAAFEANPGVGLVSVMAREMTHDGALTDRITGKRSPGAQYTFDDLLRGGWCSWFVVERELLEQIGGFDERLRSAEECDLCLRLFDRTRMLALREPLLHKRGHDDNLTRDQRLNARCWLAILDRLERERPDLLRRSRRAFRRCRGKAHLRLGRELMLAANGDPEMLGESRRHLLAGLRQHPLFVRGYYYLLSNLLAPRWFSARRRRPANPER